MSDKVLMPRSLTAENGAKGIFRGEFNIESKVVCNECEGLGHAEDEDMSECDECGGRGDFTRQEPIPWNTIKEIYELAVTEFGKPPSGE
jgi:DnaJ-class molecular chaperone